MISAKIKVESSEETASNLEKENKELLLNKAKLETSLADALLGKVKGQTLAGQEHNQVNNKNLGKQDRPSDSSHEELSTATNQASPAQQDGNKKQNSNRKK